MIDKSSPIPLYHQLRLHIESEIADRPPGDRLPSEADLCMAHQVSRTVVRQALGELERAGMIVRVRGRGSFVAPEKIAGQLVQSLTSLHEDVAARGQELETRVLSHRGERASPSVAVALHLAEGDEVIVLERLRYVDGEPWELTTAHLPFTLCQELLDMDMTERSLYATLEAELGLEIHRGTRSVEVAQANEMTAAHLELEVGAPILVLKGVTYLADGRPIEQFVGIHRGDKSRFEVELLRHPADGRRAATPMALAPHRA